MADMLRGGISRDTDSPSRLWRAGSIGVLVLGTSLALVGAGAWHRTLASSNRLVIQTQADHVTGELSTALHGYDDLVTESAVGIGSGALTPEEFQSLETQSDLRGRYPGIVGVGFVSYSAAPAGISLSGSATTGPSCVATLAVWALGATPQPIVGSDLCSVISLNRALLSSIDRGAEVAIPGRSIGPGLESLFLLLRPYSTSTIGATGQPSRTPVGWGAALIDGPTLLDRLQTGNERSTALALYAGSSGHPDNLVAAVGPTGNSTPVDSRMLTFDAGSPWSVRMEVFSSYPGLSSPWTLPIGILVVGFALVGLLAYVGWTLSRGRRRAEGAARTSHVALQRSEARFESLAAGSPVGIAELTLDLRVTYMNARMELIAGRPASELLGLRWIDYIHPDDRTTFLRLATGPRGAVTDDFASSMRFVRPSGEIRTIRVHTAGVSAAAPDSPVDRYVATVEDITEEVELEEELRHQALHDSLTGLPNRTLFLDRVQEALRAAERTGARPAVLFLDLDRFKIVNDSLGHTAGDRLLALLADGRGLRSATALARRITDALKGPFEIGDRELFVTASIGITLAKPGRTPETILREADTAMYAAKRQGRDRYAVFRDGLFERSMAQLTLEADLRRALDNGQLEMYYQPVIELATGRSVGAEALMRWHHPLRGTLMPGQFIPMAEESGLIVPLGQWAFEAAVAQLSRWDLFGPRLESMAVNVSAQQLRDQRRSTERRRVLADAGIDPHRVCAEITEASLMDDHAVTRRAIDLMSGDGIDIAIDDFGTGYSSLAYLQSLPVTTLKIDRRFINELGHSDEADAIVAAIIEMAHRLGLRVVAEGVETERQLARLRGFGCDAAQGYLWAEPMPAPEFDAWHALHGLSTAAPAVRAG